MLVLRSGFFALLVFAYEARALPGIPNGLYQGLGSMRVAGQESSQYQASLKLEDAVMIAEYVYPGGRTVSYTAVIVETGHQQFLIKEGDTEIGSGYCQEQMCHLDVPGHKAEETLILRNGELLRLGSMDHGDADLIYSETLTLKESLQ